jgi:hypothetical protein
MVWDLQQQHNLEDCLKCATSRGLRPTESGLALKKEVSK